jgi:hypothetical protein
MIEHVQINAPDAEEMIESTLPIVIYAELLLVTFYKKPANLTPLLWRSHDLQGKGTHRVVKMPVITTIVQVQGRGRGA